MSFSGVTRKSSSPDLYLTQPTPAECQKIWKSTYSSWGDSLTLPQFLDECAYLLTVPLALNGGMTIWILTDKNLPADERPILASCETIKKKALLACADEGVRYVVIHGIASVFCSQEHRGHGYSQRMLRNLGGVLKTWQIGVEETCVGSVLYSDIGKEYYTKLGWPPVGRNTHMTIPAKKRVDALDPESETVVFDADLKDLCALDITLVRTRLTDNAQNELVVLPDEDHMRWHHAKENFICDNIFKEKCTSKGVVVGSQEDKNRSWAIWTRRFYGERAARKENNLYILRLGFEIQNPDKEAMTTMRKSLKSILDAAQSEADHWNLSTVKLWDSSPLVLELIRETDIEYELVEREQASIASLMWYGNGVVPSWAANEKYAWL